MKKRITVYWLMPAQAEAELFRDIIRILAAQYDAPRFEPHLTLGKAEAGSSPAKVFRQLGIRPVRLRLTGITESSKFTQTLTAQFTPNKSLDQLVRALGGPKPLPNPHVSLIYKPMSPSTRKGLVRAIQLPFRFVTFDRVKAVSCIVPAETRRDVESWRVLATRRLHE